MTLWELAPFQVRSSVFEIESYLMWLQKWKGGLWHQIWGWRQFPWAERQSECQPEAENCVRVHTHTHPIAGWLTSTNLPGAAKKYAIQSKTLFNMYVSWFCAQILVYKNITNESDGNLPFQHLGSQGPQNKPPRKLPLAPCYEKVTCLFLSIFFFLST